MKIPTLTQIKDNRLWYLPFLPPGMNVSGELGFFAAAMFAALCYAACFLFRLFDHIDQLYVWLDGQRTLNTEAVMTPFYQVFEHAWVSYLIVLMCMLGWGVYHYLYYRQESKSIYTMRRLPDDISFLRYTWTLTVCEAVICLLFALGCLGLSYGLYHWLTPEACLVGGQWTMFLENLFDWK